MFLRRFLGIVVILSAAIAIPVSAQPDKAAKEKAVADAKDALKKADEAHKAAEKALADNKDDAKKADLQKAVDAAKKAHTDAKDALDKAEKALSDKPAEKALLKWTLEKDKSDFYQKMTTKTTQTMKVMNNEVKQTQEQTFYFKWSIGATKGDEVTIKQKIEGVQMNIDIGNQKISYDSTNPKDATANNPLADFFKALKDSEFTITLNTKTMKVTDIDGHKEFIEKLGKLNPQMKPLLETILSKEALKQMAAPTFSAIPGTEQTIGTPWEDKTSLDMGPIGKYDNVYKYTYEGKDKEKTTLDRIKVETSLKYTPPTEAAGTGTGGLPFKIKSADLKSTKADGTVLFDAKLGRILSSSMKLNLDGKLSIEIGGQVTEVELNQVQDSTVENSDKTLLPEKKP